MFACGKEKHVARIVFKPMNQGSSIDNEMCDVTVSGGFESISLNKQNKQLNDRQSE